MNHAFQRRALLALILGASSLSWARKTDFTESHLGVTMGSGTYFHWLPNDNAFDPVPGATPATGTITGSEDTYLLPVRFGLFRDSPRGGFSVYFNYLLNLPRATWTVAGAPEGAGTTTFVGKGAGAEISVPLYQTATFRFNFIGNAEYVWQGATLSFTETGGVAESLKLSTRSLLTGVGFQPEIWLGDQYSFGMTAMYQYGFARTWSVSTATSFMGTSQAVGPLLNPTSGGTVRAEFGGFYFGAALKLNFQ
jgi:hypothetical protein